MIDRARYEKRLAAKSIPTTIVATRPSTPPGMRPTGGWSRGKNRDLRHNCWLVATADPARKRNDVEHLVSFDTAVDFPGRLLSDDSFNSDRLTKKVLVLSCLTIGPRENGALDATYIAQMSRRFDWLLRYRLAEGYESFAHIPTFFASDISKRLKAGGVLALVPIEDRLEKLFTTSAERDNSAPVAAPGIDRALAAKLGVTAASLARSSEFQLALIDANPRLSIEEVSALKSALEGEAGEEEDVGQPDDDPDDPDRRVASDLKVERNLHGYLEILEFLFRLSGRELDHDRIESDPFSEMSMDAILTRDRRSAGRTATLLPWDMMRAMTAAARFVATYSQYIISTFRDLRSFDQKGVKSFETPSSSRLMPKGGTRVLPLWNRGGSDDRPENTILLDEAVRHLLAACAILIAGFAARRDIGVRSAHYGCLAEKENGLLFMSIYIGKTDKDRVDIPVPAILKIVVQTLEELSADTREAKGTKWLFEVAFDLNKLTRLVSSRFHQTIDAFLKFAGAAPPEGQDSWNLSIHMLRRGYGIWYFYGLTGGSTDALSMMFRHNDPNMTRIYFTMALPGEINRLKSELDVRLRSSVANRTKEDQAWIDSAYDRLSYLKSHQQAFDEPRCEIFVEKMLGLWKGTESVIGAGGKALYNDVQAIAERAMASIRIGSRANDPGALQTPLLQRFFDYAETHFLEPVLGTNMWCAANPHDPQHRANAECLKLKGRGNAPWKKDGRPEDLMPDFDFACNRVCVGCRFGAAFNDGQRALQEEVEEHRRAAGDAATASLKHEGELLLAELEAAITRAGPVSKGGNI
ncbi:tyrosine-type recombinase/integrase [Sinorhizobium meliloti]|nr:tyrosine-type recombinase/integrase [Sinorhizobium meliloti]MDW9511216.1 tyrosine-type recombinase/integrase [Sinorhizobium meliloti]MDW9921733.1 tyrosine-type recombinase/integrase [Sinorhizobium meliloti]MDW9925959.1 tyrosine-type recombinase/integrase [Sinorhizobium meliloti]MDX0032879.1 tyrosine-type recombinase/integrase [Sinorhizobium meliloti]